MSGRFCSSPKSIFFKAEPLGPQEAPDRVVADVYAPGGKFVRQPVQGQVGGLLQTGDDPVPLRLKQNRPVATAFTWLKRAGPILKARPLHHRRWRNAEPPTDISATLPAAISRNRPLPKINRIVPSHRRSPPDPALRLNQSSNQTGILPI